MAEYKVNETLGIIMNRRSTRKFNDHPVMEEQLAAIVEAGRYAPTGGNSQSVHFVVMINAEVREKLRVLVQNAFLHMELSDDMYNSLKNSIRLSREGNYVFDYHAPILIVVSNRRGYPNAIADSACALQNMMLEAESLGVGSCWINQLHWLDEDPDIRAYLEPLGIGEDETICGALALGNYDTKQEVKPRTGMKVDYVR
ncbi:MAG: nitroreductase family protein [Lachnospiraceae bacterium]|nr:nitroreductase family protein [Lachnospiraceae bacterium]